MLTSLGYWSLSGLDRWIIISQAGEDALGLYSVAYKFSMVFEAILINPVWQVLSPYWFRQYSQKRFNQPILKIALVTIILFLCLGLLMQWVAGMLIDAQFYASLPLIPVLVSSVGFFFIAQMGSNLLNYRKKKLLLLINILCVVLINIVLNLVLIPQWGVMGAAVAFLISNMIWAALSIAQERRLRVVHLDDR
jgi:O-antigen/teichoic acid export membrane protein